jgi:hypothetical protein
LNLHGSAKISNSRDLPRKKWTRGLVLGRLYVRRMGISGLLPLLKEVQVKKHVSDFKGKR